MSLLSTKTTTTAPEVEFQPLSPSEWRVSDPRIAAGDAGSILGFVEKTPDNRFQLLQLGHGHGVTWMSFSSLSEVREHFMRHAA